MALYSRHDYLNLRPFHGADDDDFGDAGVPPDPEEYQTTWPGIAGQALQLWPGAAPILNAAGLNVPYADQAPAGISAPAPAPESSGFTMTPVMWAAAAVGVWYFFLRK